MQCRDPEATAARWAAITGLTLYGLRLCLDNAIVAFAGGTGPDHLAAVTLSCTDPARVGQTAVIGGVEFRLAPHVPI